MSQNGDRFVKIFPSNAAAPRAVAAPHRDICIARLLGVMTMLTVFLMSCGAFARGAPDSFADLAERLMPSVVNISTAQSVKAPNMSDVLPQVPPGSPFEDLFREFFEQQQRGKEHRSRQITSLGSGFIVDASGLVVTNNHVIADADEITIVLHDERRYPAEVIGRDKKTDLALLKFEPDEPLTAVTFGDSDKLRVGDWVVAIGNPFGLGNTVTAGILSARGRDINAGPYDDFLQTDASINRGNSGGPLFNMDGEVIGINTAIFSPSGGSVGIGFAVPASLAQPVIAQLKEHGRTRRGWLGVRIQSVNEDIAESLGLDKPRGALVADVTPDSPAAAAGIKTGDVILEFNGQDIPEMRDLPRIVAATKIDEFVDVIVLRKGEEMIVRVKIAELDENQPVLASLTTEGAEAEAPEVETLGMTLVAITDELRERYDLGDENEGVLVTMIDPNSSAAAEGIRPGDIILEIGLEPVTSPSQAAATLEKVCADECKKVLILFKRGDAPSFVAVDVDRG